MKIPKGITTVVKKTVWVLLKNKKEKRASESKNFLIMKRASVRRSWKEGPEMISLSARGQYRRNGR